MTSERSGLCPQPPPPILLSLTGRAVATSFLPYHISHSADGTAWSPLQPLPAGCARPRLLNVHGTGVLLMSGGRFHAAKPPTSDVILWASKDSELRPPTTRAATALWTQRRV